MKLNDRSLFKLANMLNDRFFEGRINGVSIRFGKPPEDAEGAYSHERKSIVIDSKFKTHLTTTHLILLHELAHADLMARGYRGYEETQGHGDQFAVEIHRLYVMGAYDGLLMALLFIPMLFHIFGG